MATGLPPLAMEKRESGRGRTMTYIRRDIEQLRRNKRTTVTLSWRKAIHRLTSCVII